MELDIIVTTFGSYEWNTMGAEAADAANDQARAHHFHDMNSPSLGGSRNRAVDAVNPQEWICFLDADDELEAGYVDAMNKAYDIFKPEDTLYVPSLKLGRGKPESLGNRNVLDMNPCPIGTLIHRSTFERAGRFWNESAWEDWSLFRRAYLTGATLTFVTDAVYHARSHRHGRNSTVSDPDKLRRRIQQSHEEWLNDS